MEKEKNKEESYEESLGSKNEEDSLDFDLDLDKYDQRGKAIQDMDLYPIRTAIPRRNKSNFISEQEIFEEEDKEEIQR